MSMTSLHTHTYNERESLVMCNYQRRSCPQDTTKNRQVCLCMLADIRSYQPVALTCLLKFYSELKLVYIRVADKIYVVITKLFARVTLHCIGRVRERLIALGAHTQRFDTYV